MGLCPIELIQFNMSPSLVQMFVIGRTKTLHLKKTLPIFKTYNPTSYDVQYLMDALLATEEDRRIHAEARAHMRMQGTEEAPEAYLKRLKEAYRQYIPVDPDEAANAPIIKTAFVAQAAPDICRKIQMGHTLKWMLEIAQTTYNQREEEAQKKKGEVPGREVDGPEDGRSTVRRRRGGRGRLGKSNSMPSRI